MYIFIEKEDSVYYFGGLTMNFMEELDRETQLWLKKINMYKKEKTDKANKRIAELQTLIDHWEEENK